MSIYFRCHAFTARKIYFAIIAAWNNHATAHKAPQMQCLSLYIYLIAVSSHTPP
jgi:hypothetical protein